MTRLLRQAALPTATLLLLFGYFWMRESSAGVQVTPVACPSTDMAQLLDAHLWEFDITHTPQSLPGMEEDVTLALRRPGKPPLTVASLDSSGDADTPLHDGRLIVGIVPIDGGDLQHAHKIRCYIRGYGCSSANIVDNFFLNTSWSTSGDEADREADHSFRLAAIKDTSQGAVPMSPNAGDLVLTVGICRTPVPATALKRMTP